MPSQSVGTLSDARTGPTTAFTSLGNGDVLTREFVSALADIRSCITSDPVFATEQVFSRTDLLKMIRPDTERVLAFVVDLGTAKDRADKSGIRETVNQNSPGVDKESDVAIISAPCGPIPTSIGFIHVGPKRSHRVWYSPHTLERSIRKRYGK